MILRKLTMGLTLSLSIIAGPILVAVPSAAADVAYSTPTGLKTTDQTPTSVGLSWNAVAGAPQYRVQYSKYSDMQDSSYARSHEGDAKTDIRDLAPDTTYYFKVRVIKTDGSNLSSYSTSIEVKTKPAPVLSVIPNQLSVATYNIHCANCDDDPAKSWINRRDSVIANVKSRMPDVIGVQEASQGWITDENGVRLNLSQFEDFRNRLNTAGAPYEVTNPHRNNCVNSTTPTNCVYADQGASLGAKIFYNKTKVTLLAQGSAALPNLPGDDGNRYMSWASLRQNSTGKSFFVANAHLDPRSGTPELFELRRQQAQKINQVIAEKNTEKLPVLIAGDMNSSKWVTPSNAPYDEFTKAGYVDPTGGTWMTSIASGYATAEKMINGRYNSFNGFSPNLGKTSLTGDRALGSHIDYIFTSKMRVAEWEQVLNIDSNGVLQGEIPSDHNMIMVKVGLPEVTTPPLTTSGKVLKAVDREGKLWSYKVPGNATLGSRTEVGTGWGTAKQILSVDWNSDGILDIVTRTGTGSLTMSAGIGGDKFKSPIIIGSGGWQNYDITATKLRTTDKYPGLVARNTVEGKLYYYSNPSGAAHGSRVMIGNGGWTPMTEINALDWDNNGTMDLIVRNSAGKQLLYRTNGAGTILDEARPVVGIGWGIFASINAVPDFAYPGSAGVLAQTTSGELRYYPIANGRFGTHTVVGQYWTGYNIATGTIGK
jgi:endonuclease/exonuclease/phosphatase family metal-dependent hydrolase